MSTIGKIGGKPPLPVRAASTERGAGPAKRGTVFERALDRIDASGDTDDTAGRGGAGGHAPGPWSLEHRGPVVTTHDGRAYVVCGGREAPEGSGMYRGATLYVGSGGQSAWRPYPLQNPQRVRLGADGAVYVQTGERRTHIVRVNSLETAFADDDGALPPHHSVTVGRPIDDFAVAPDGAVYVIDAASGRLGRVGGSGDEAIVPVVGADAPVPVVWMPEATSPPTAVRSIAVDDQGILWALREDNAVVALVPPTGERPARWGPPVSGGKSRVIEHLATVGDGSIAAIGPDGVATPFTDARAGDALRWAKLPEAALHTRLPEQVHGGAARSRPDLPLAQRLALYARAHWPQRVRHSLGTACVEAMQAEAQQAAHTLRRCLTDPARRQGAPTALAAVRAHPLFDTVIDGALEDLRTLADQLGVDPFGAADAHVSADQTRRLRQVTGWPANTLCSGANALSLITRALGALGGRPTERGPAADSRQQRLDTAYRLAYALLARGVAIDAGPLVGDGVAGGNTVLPLPQTPAGRRRGRNSLGQLYRPLTDRLMVRLAAALDPAAAKSVSPAALDARLEALEASSHLRPGARNLFPRHYDDVRQLHLPLDTMERLSPGRDGWRLADHALSLGGRLEGDAVERFVRMARQLAPGESMAFAVNRGLGIDLSTLELSLDRLKQRLPLDVFTVLRLRVFLLAGQGEGVRIEVGNQGPPAPGQEAIYRLSLFVDKVKSLSLGASAHLRRDGPVVPIGGAFVTLGAGLDADATVTRRDNSTHAFTLEFGPGKRQRLETILRELMRGQMRDPMPMLAASDRIVYRVARERESLLRVTGGVNAYGGGGSVTGPTTHIAVGGLMGVTGFEVPLAKHREVDDTHSPGSDAPRACEQGQDTAVRPRVFASAGPFGWALGITPLSENLSDRITYQFKYWAGEVAAGGAAPTGVRTLLLDRHGQVADLRVETAMPAGRLYRDADIAALAKAQPRFGALLRTLAEHDRGRLNVTVVKQLTDAAKARLAAYDAERHGDRDRYRDGIVDAPGSVQVTRLQALNTKTFSTGNTFGVLLTRNSKADLSLTIADAMIDLTHGENGEVHIAAHGRVLEPAEHRAPPDAAALDRQLFATTLATYLEHELGMPALAAGECAGAFATVFGKGAHYGSLTKAQRKAADLDLWSAAHGIAGRGGEAGLRRVVFRATGVVPATLRARLDALGQRLGASRKAHAQARRDIADTLGVDLAGADEVHADLRALLARRTGPRRSAGDEALARRVVDDVLAFSQAGVPLPGLVPLVAKWFDRPKALVTSRLENAMRLEVSAELAADDVGPPRPPHPTLPDPASPSELPGPADGREDWQARFERIAAQYGHGGADSAQASVDASAADEATGGPADEGNGPGYRPPGAGP